MSYLIAFLVAVLWIVGVNQGILSYLLHTPSALTMESWRGMVTHVAWPILLLLFVIGVCFGIGRRCLDALRCPEKDGESHLIAVGLGFGILGLVVYLIGLGGLYGPKTFAFIFATGMIISIRPLQRLYQDNAPTQFRLTSLPWAAVPIAALILFALWHVTIQALTPATTWDVLAYHLAIPKLYLKAGVIQAIPWLLHAHWPHLTEVLYGMALAWRAPELASLLHACGAFMILVWLWIVACRLFNRWTALLAVAMMAPQHVFLAFAGTAHCDALYALFFLLGISALWKAVAQKSRSWLIVSGFLIGFSASIKLTGSLFLLLLGLGILLYPKTSHPRWKWSLLFAASGFLVLLPWLVHTLLVSGDPAWPFLSKWLPDKEGGASIRSLYLYNCAWRGSAFLRHVDLYGGQYFLIPFFLFGLTALRATRRPPGFLLTLLFPVPFYILFFVRHTELWRFAWPLIPGMLLATASGLNHSISKGGFQRIAAMATLLIAIIPIASLSQNNALFAVLELRSLARADEAPRDLYLSRTLDHYDFYKRLNASLPPNSKVFLFQEIRGYYLDCQYQWGDPINQGLIRFREIPDEAALLKQLQRFHITHVLRNRRNAQYQLDEMYYSAHILNLMDRLLERYADPIDSENGLSLYRLKDLDRHHAPS